MSNSFLIGFSARAVVFCLLCLCPAVLPAAAAEIITPYTGGIMPWARGTAGAAAVPIRPQAGIVSHHGLASAMISRFYDALAQNRNIESIILIGPDHFRAGRRSVTVCPSPWQVDEKQININVDTLQNLKQTNVINVESLPFRMEHSIGLHVYFIGHYFSHATLTAIIVNNEASTFALAKIASALARAMGERTLLILSMDFSHEKLPEEARREDDRSLERILAFRTRELGGLNIDARRAAWLFLEVLKLKNIDRGVVLERTNSSEIANRPDLPCTSYASVVFGRQK